jgi:hypothetical protein
LVEAREQAGTGGGGPPGDAGARIDAMMERAQAALERTAYFEAQREAVRALLLARRSADFERMARIVLPLLEARRQIRQAAIDTGRAVLVCTPEDVPTPVRAGCYLLQPPMIGLDGRRLRELADEHEIPVFVLVREPLANDGRWPVVGVGDVVVRTKVAPPVPLDVVKGSSTRDGWEAPPPLAWMEAAHEALGDAAIASAERVAAEDPPMFLVDDLLERLPGVPEHEKLLQRLERACRGAMGQPIPETPRRRGAVFDPFTF